MEADLHIFEKSDFSFKGRVDSYLVERETPGSITSDFTIPGLKGSGTLVEVYATTRVDFALTPIT